MSWQQWLLIVLFAFNACMTILYVGRARDVVTPRVAMITVVLDALLVLAVVSI